MSDFIELRTVLLTLRRWWWLLVLCTLLGVGAGYGYSHLQTPIYRATTRLAVAQMVEANTLRFSDVETISQQLRTYADLAIRRPLLDAVIQELALTESWEQLQARVRAVAQEESQLLQITVDDPAPAQAQQIAEQIAQQLLLRNAAEQKTIAYAEQAAFVQTQVAEATQQLQEGQRQLDILRTIQGTAIITDTAPPLWAYWLSPANGISALDPTGERTRRLAEEIDRLERFMIEWDKSYNRWNTILQEIASFKSLTVVDPAYVSPAPVSPQRQLNTIAAGALGLLLALGFVAFFEGWSDTLKASDDLSRFTRVPLLGAVRQIKGKTTREKLLLNRDTPTVLNDYRLLHSKFQLMCTKLPKRILITSPNAEEGRSLFVANLGIVAAQFGYRTLIADADWRHPTQHELFQIANEKGLLQLLRNPTANTTVPMWSVNRLPNLALLTSGGAHAQSIPVATEGALAVGWSQPERLGHVLNQLTGHADLILLDSSPLLLSAETVALAGQVDGVILVVEPGKTKRRALQEALFALEQSHANLIGVVFNRAIVRLDNQFLHALLPAALTRPALESQAAEGSLDHHHVTASALSPITGDSGNDNGTAQDAPTLNGNHVAAAAPTSAKTRKRVVLPMRPAHKAKGQSHSGPRLIGTTGPAQTDPAAMAEPAHGQISLAEMGIDTITLHSKHNTIDIALSLPATHNFTAGATLRLDLLPWMAAPVATNGHTEATKPEQSNAENGVRGSRQKHYRHLLAVTLDDVALGNVPLEQSQSQTVTLAIPPLAEEQDSRTQHILRCRLCVAKPTDVAAPAPEIATALITDTVVVIRSTSTFLFATEESPANRPDAIFESE